MLLEADLPDDVDALRALVLEQAHELDILKVFRAENERLQAIIDALMRHRFGRKSEQLDADQFELALEEVEAALSQAELAMNKASKAPCERPRKTNRGSLPAHLERIEQVVDVEEKACPCCGGALHQIGEDVAERLDVVPTTFWTCNGFVPVTDLTMPPWLRTRACGMSQSFAWLEKSLAFSG